MAVTPSDASVATPARRHAVFHRLRVASIERLVDDAVAITFDVPEELRDEFRFTQGQHLTLRATLGGEEVRRNYSICSPAPDGPLRVAVKRLGGGLFSVWANEVLAVGDELEVMTPTGRFFVPLDPALSRHHVFVAAGSGITPVLSLLTTTLEVEPGSRCTLVYGNRTTSSIMFLEELEDLKNRFTARFSLINVLSREAQEVELFAGRIDTAKLQQLFATLLPPAYVDEWFLCGPFELVESARASLRDAGVDASHVHFELFHVDGEPVRPPRPAPVDGAVDETTSTVTIVLDGRSTTFELAPYAESILDAALKARGDAPYACKGGVCGTCRAKVVTGAVEMDRNYALEADEIAAGVVLACQSHPTTPTVTLDFDH